MVWCSDVETLYINLLLSSLAGNFALTSRH